MNMKCLYVLLILAIIQGGKGRKCHKQHGDGLTYIDCDKTNSNCNWKNNDTNFDDRAWPTVCYEEKIANFCLSRSFIFVECQLEPEEMSQVSLCCCNEISCGLKKGQNGRKIGGVNFGPGGAPIPDLAGLTQAINLINTALEILHTLTTKVDEKTAELSGMIQAGETILNDKLNNINDTTNSMNATITANFEKMQTSIDDVMFMTMITAAGLGVAIISLILNIGLMIVLCICVIHKKKSKTPMPNGGFAVSPSSEYFIAGQAGQAASPGSPYTKSSEEKKGKEDKKKGKKK